MNPRRLFFPIAASAWLTLACGLTMTAALFFWVHGFEQDREDTEFEHRADYIATALRQGVNDVVQALQVVNASFATFTPLSHEQFHDFTQPLLQRYPYIRAFSFQRLVRHEERPRFEAQMQRRFPGFAITSVEDGKKVRAVDKAEYRVVDYIEPKAQNNIVFGMDASSRRFQESAVQRALDTGQPAATAMHRLIQDKDSSQGFLIMLPVYRPGARPWSAAERRQAVVGYTVAVLRSHELFESIFSPLETAILSHADISIYVGEEAGESTLAFRRSSTRKAAGSLFPQPPWWRDEPLKFTNTLDVAGVPWHLVVSPMPSDFIDSHFGSLLCAVAGALLSGFAAGFVQSLSLRARRTQAIVNARTAELKETNQRLTEDIVARKNVEAALQDSQALLRQLAAHQEGIREDERKRIAREIHDELGQSLLALRIDVSMLHSRTQEQTLINEKVGAALAQIDRTMKAVRNIINNLRPAVLDLGLHAAIEWQAKEFERRSGIACELEIDHEEFELEDAHATALFRIVQESLTNVQRHARAKRVRLALRRRAGRLFMEIADDGIGLAADRRKAGAFGLLGMEERIKAIDGTLSIGSTAGSGTVLTISIPLPASAPAAVPVPDAAPSSTLVPVPGPVAENTPTMS